MTDDTTSAHVVAAILGLDAAERAAASRAGWDSMEEWSLAWGGVVTAQRALLAAAGPRLGAQAAALESLEAGDCAEYLRACVWALETIGPRADMPELMVARAYVEDVAREVAAIDAKGSEPSESGGSWSRLKAALLTMGHRSCIGDPAPATPAPHLIAAEPAGHEAAPEKLRDADLVYIRVPAQEVSEPALLAASQG